MGRSNRLDENLHGEGDFFSKLKLSDIKIDNFVFRLHYLVTVSLIVGYTVILTINTTAGDPIDCEFDDEVSVRLGTYMDDYCYIHGTKTLKDANCKESADHGSLTGVGGAGKDEKGCWGENADDEACVNHEYYQWVAFMLLAQAVCFYIPGGLWAHWEEGRIKESVGDNGTGGIQSCLNKEESLETQAKTIAKDINDNRGKHGLWAAKFTICEFLNLGNVVGQFYLTDWFLAGEFRNYGIKAAEFFNSDNDRCDPMDQMLPITTMCNFHYFGTGGGMVNKHALCVLPTNIWNQKFYFIFYYWLLFLISVTSIQCIFRLLSILDSHVRDIFLVLPQMDKKQWMFVAYGDWLFANLVVGNLNSVVKAQVKKQFK